MTYSKNDTYVKQVLKKIKKAYNLETDASLARFLEMKPNTLAMQKKRGSLNWVRIFEKCSDIDKNWLLHSTHESSDEFPIIIPLVKQSNIKASGSLLKGQTPHRKVTFPRYLLPDGLAGQSDQLILVNINQPPQSSGLSNGDLVLTHINSTKPIDNKFYLVKHHEETILTRISKESQDQLILLDKPSDTSHTTVDRNKNDFSILGRIYWVGSKL